MNNQVVIPKVDASGIYEGGSITQISAEELRDNLVAIKQLINSHNLIATESRHKDQEIQQVKAEIEYLKTSPFVSIISALISIAGSLLIGIATNLITADTEPKVRDKITLSIGGLLVIIGALANILYPKAREFFNKK